MDESTKKPRLKKFLSFFVDAPKQSINKTKSLAKAFTLHISPQIETNQVDKETSQKNVIEEEQNENNEINFDQNSQIEVMKNNSKVSSIGKFASFFKKASVQIEEKTLKNIESLKRCLTAQSKNEINCNSSLAVSQLEDQLIDKNAASFANMTLELSMNTNVLHQMALPSKDTNQSHRELNFDLTQNPILEKSESQENILIEQNFDPILEQVQSDLDIKNKILNENKNKKQNLEKFQAFIKKSPSLIKQKSIQQFQRFFKDYQPKYQEVEQSKEQMEQQESQNLKVNNEQNKINTLENQQDGVKINEPTGNKKQKLKNFFVQGPKYIKQKSINCFSSFKLKYNSKSKNEKNYLSSSEYYKNLIQNGENKIIIQSDPNKQIHQKKSDEINEWLENEEKELFVNSAEQLQNTNQKDPNKSQKIEEENLTDQKYYDNEFQGNTEREQELTNIQQRSFHQDSYYSEAGHMVDILQQQQKVESSQIEQTNIIVKDQNSEATSKIFSKDDLKQQYELINQEISQLRIDKQLIIKQKNVQIKGSFQPNYKNFADIADDNEALYKAKDLIKKMNQQRQGRMNRQQQQHKKIEEYFFNLENLRQNQEEMKNRYEQQRKQQIQQRIDEYQKKQREFHQLQQISNNFVKKLTNQGPQHGQLAKEVENNVSQVKGGYRKLKLQNYGIHLPKIQQNQSINLQLYMNEELVRSRQDEMINKYQASKMALLKSAD